MARHLVYIYRIQQDSFLHFSDNSAGAFCLRHFTSPTEVVEKMGHGSKNPHNWRAADILAMAGQEGNHLFEPPQPCPDVTNTQFWYDHIQQLNRRHGISGDSPLAKGNAELQKLRAGLQQCQAAYAKCTETLQSTKAELIKCHAELEKTKGELMKCKADHRLAISEFGKALNTLYSQLKERI